jgi:hypothetical protein
MATFLVELLGSPSSIGVAVSPSSDSSLTEIPPKYEP